jgi:hypothetical protein
MPQAFEKRDRRSAELSVTVRFRTQGTLPSIERRDDQAAGGRDRDESMGQAAMPRIARRIEHVRQPRAHETAERASD